LKLVCPACGAHASAEAWENDTEARRALDVARGLPKGALAYVGMFRKPGGGGVRWTTARKRLQELVRMVNSGWIQVDKNPARQASVSVWKEAIARMLDNPPRRLPLKNHRYLMQVVYDIADSSDREAEVTRNRAERQGNPRKPETGGHRFGSGPMASIGDLVRIQADAVQSREDVRQASARVVSIVRDLADHEVKPFFERVIEAAPNDFTKKQLEKHRNGSVARLREFMGQNVMAVRIIDEMPV